MFESNEKVGITFLIDDLNDLIQMHYDVVAGHRAVQVKARGCGVKAVVEKFTSQHEVQIAALSKLVRSYGGEPRSRSDAETMAAMMRIALDQVFDDVSIYAVMRINERKLLQEYERSLRSLSAIPGLEPVLADNYESTRRRVRSIEDSFRQMQDRQVEFGVR